MYINKVKDEYLIRYLKTVLYKEFEFELGININDINKIELIENKQKYQGKNKKILNKLNQINKKEKNFTFNLTKLYDEFENIEEFFVLIGKNNKELSMYNLECQIKINDDQTYEISYTFDKDNVIEKFSESELNDFYEENESIDKFSRNTKKFFNIIYNSIKDISIETGNYKAEIEFLNKKNLLALFKNNFEIQDRIKELRLYFSYIESMNLDFFFEDPTKEFKMISEKKITQEEKDNYDKKINELNINTNNYKEKLKEYRILNKELSLRETKSLRIEIIDNLKLKLIKEKIKKEKLKKINKNKKNDFNNIDMIL